MKPATICVTVVTGFLGAGKSTLLQNWLDQLPRKETAVIINEWGEVGIDGELLAIRASWLREITGGCACCQTQAELVRALDELSVADHPPSRVLIETSGAASPAGVLRTITAPRSGTRLSLDGVIAAVDVTRAREALAFELAVEQLAFSDIVVLTHVDQADETTPRIDLDALQARVLRHARAAIIAKASRGVVTQSLMQLLAQRTETLCLPAGPSNHPEHTSVDAASMIVDGELDEELFGDWVETVLGSVQARILRIKGILAMSGVEARVIVQGVGDAIDVQLGAPWGDAQRTSRLVVLGLGLDTTALEAGFMACTRMHGVGSTATDD